MNATDEWIILLEELIQHGNMVVPRGRATKEILDYRTVIYTDASVVLSKTRKVGYKFMNAEAAWIISGDDQVKTIAPYSKEISRFSDDGVSFYGAYGPRFREQVNSVVDKLVEDQFTRQAVVSLWRPNPPPTKDVPCTLTLQWVIRNLKLQCSVCMRSSDAWLGVVYDWRNFSLMTLYVSLRLLERGLDIKPEFLYFNAFSQHLYLDDQLRAEECVKNYDAGDDELEMPDGWYLDNIAARCSGPEDLPRVLKELADAPA